MKYCNSTTDCFLNAIIPLPSIIYIIIKVIIKLKLKYNIYDNINDNSNNSNNWNQAIINFDKPSQYHLLLVAVFLLLIQMILILAFSCDDKRSGSLIFCTFFQLLGWIMITYNIVQESWYIYLWPSKTVKIFIVSYMIIYLLVAAIKRENNS